MTQLSPEARRLIRLARPHDEPSPAALQRIEHGLATRLARGLGLTAAGALWAQSASGVALGTSKLVVAVALAGAASAIGVWAMPSHWTAPVVAKKTLVSQPPVVQVQQRPNPTPVSSSSAAVLIEDLPVQAVPATRATPRAVAPGAVVEAVEMPDRLREETQELRSAQQALRAGNAGLALKLLAGQDQAFKNGLLQEERAAARVLALCQSGRRDLAITEAERFEKRWPRSALVARVRSSCF